MTTRVETLESELATAQAKIQTLEDTVEAEEAKVQTLEEAATASATAASTLTDRVGDVESAATTLKDDFEDRSIVKAGWIETARQKDEDEDGVITLAEFCLEGPAVAEVSAFISVIPTDPRIQLTLWVDDGDGRDAKTFQLVFDDSNTDMISLNWLGAIKADATVTLELKGFETASSDRVTQQGGSISYKLYDENFPLEAGWPAGNCEINPYI